MESLLSKWGTVCALFGMPTIEVRVASGCREFNWGTAWADENLRYWVNWRKLGTSELLRYYGLIVPGTIPKGFQRLAGG